jgi:hypothetical protein
VLRLVASYFGQPVNGMPKQCDKHYADGSGKREPNTTELTREYELA